MACKLQHYISQHHQRGFTDGQGAKAPVWVYRSDGKVFRTGTAGYGASNYFYSDLPEHPDEVTVDQKVTEFEGVIHPWISQLREAEIGAPVDGARAGSLVTHLSVRTAFLRDSVGGATTEMLDTMGEMAASGHLATLLGIGTKAGAQVIMDAANKQIEEMITKTELASMPTQVQDLMRTLGQLMALNMAAGGMNDEINALGIQSLGMLETVKSQVQPTMRERLGASLMDQPAPLKHVERLAALDWVLEAPLDTEGAILPDCVSVARESSGRVSGYMGTRYEQMIAVALPVSSDRILVGRADAAPSFTNAEMAASSHSAFISNRKSDELASLIQTIGASPAIDLGDEQSGLIADLRSGRIHGA
ncbi:hypothetical protein [Maricaulis sp.]|uniref:hypothetical protein n=1 Tax=Maricaulis sp. TaxID=1486257 RepID=UPI003A8EEB19